MALKTLLVCRFILIVLSLGFSVAGLAFGIKEVSDRRKFANKLGCTLIVKDMMGVVISTTVAMALGVGASLISELFLHIERKRGLATSKRILNEVLLALSAITILGCTIAGTIVAQRDAQIVSPILDQNTINMSLKSLHISKRYRDTWGWKAIWMGWGAFATVSMTLLLVLAAGAHYRKQGIRGPNRQAQQSGSPYEGSIEKGQIEMRE